MSERWHEDERPSSLLQAVGGSGLGRTAIAAMVVSAVGQLLCNFFITLAVLFAVVFFTLIEVYQSIGSTLSYTDVRTLLSGMAIGVGVFVVSLIPVVSALSSAFVAFRLWRGGRSTPVYVAAVLSMSGPMVFVVWASLWGQVFSEVEFAAVTLTVGASTFCIAGALLAVVVVSRAAAPEGSALHSENKALELADE